MNICIDFDGTITEPFYWLDEANRYFKKAIKPETITCYDHHLVLDVSEEACDNFLRQYEMKLHMEAKIRPHAETVINGFMTSHRVHIVTARIETLREVSQKWLEMNHITVDSLHLLGHHNKTDIAWHLNCDLFIEDRADIALELSEAGFEVLLIDCSYNQVELPDKIERMSDWKQIESYVQAYQMLRSRQQKT